MAKHLVVTSAFGSFSIGDRITDADQVDQFLASHRPSVVPVIVEGEPEPAPEPVKFVRFGDDLTK